MAHLQDVVPDHGPLIRRALLAGEMRKEAHVARAEPALHEVLAELRAVAERVEQDFVNSVGKRAVVTCRKVHL